MVPHFLAWRLREYGYSARLIDAAHEVNASMPQYVVQKVADALNESDRPIKGSRILLLGVAYKAGVHDTRESPSFEVLRQLLLRGGDVSYCDPWVSEFELDEQTPPQRGVDAGGRRGGRLHCAAYSAPRVPRAAALESRPARCGHAQRRAAGAARLDI